MRVLLATPYPYADPTYHALLQGLGSAYRRLGHEVELAALGDGSTAKAPVLLHQLGGGHARRSIRRGLSFFGGLRSLQGRFDRVHLHVGGLWRELLLPQAAALLSSKARIGLTFQNFDESFGAADRLLWLPALRRLTARCDWITAPSRFFAARVAEGLKLAPGRVGVVPNGFDPSEQPAVTVHPSEPYVLCLARHAEYKGVDLLLMAWKDVCDAGSPVDLLLAGEFVPEGPTVDLARRLGLASRVRFLGGRPRDEVWSLLRGCLFAVQPSRMDNCPLAVIEAMACGKPVVAFAAGGIPEIVADGVTGVLVAPKDVGALAKAIRRLLAQAGARERLGAGALAASAAYRWERLAARYVGLREPCGAAEAEKAAA